MAQIMYSVGGDSWGRVDPDAAIEEIRRRQPMIVRISNFDASLPAILHALPQRQLVVWKIEYMGDEIPHPFLKSDRGIDPEKYVDIALRSGRRVVGYTFTPFNRRRLLDVLPAVRRIPLAVVPISQKNPVGAPSAGEQEWNPAIGARGGAGTTFGLCGLLSPTKGIDELVERFAAWPERGDSRLLCSVVAPGRSGQQIHSAWSRRIGARNMRNIHVRAGNYGGWPAMVGFYREVDVVLVNSVHDSWGRVVTEAAGLGTPVVVRRAACSTNLTIPDVTVAKSFSFGSELDERIDVAKARAAALQQYVNSAYSPAAVRTAFMRDVVHPAVTRAESAELSRRLSDDSQRQCLDAQLAY